MRNESRLPRPIFLLVAAIATLVMLGVVNGPQGAAASAPRFPAAAKAIVHFDLERLRTSDLYKTVQEQIEIIGRSTDKLQLFLDATGLAAAAANIKAFTIYSFAEVDRPQDFAGVVWGDFGQEAMQRLEKAYAPVARSVNGQVIMPVVQTPEMELVMSFLGPSSLSFGTAPAVETMASTTDDAPRLVSAYKRTAAGRPIWGVIDARQVVDAVLKGIGAGGEEAQPLAAFRDNPALKSLNAIGFSIDLGRDIFIEMRAFTDDAESARLLGDAVKGMIALAQMGASQTSDPDVLAFFRQVVAENERDSIYVSFTLTQSQIEKLKGGRNLFSGVIPE